MKPTPVTAAKGRPLEREQQASEAELQEAAAMLQALYSPRSSYRSNPWPWRR